MDRLQTIVNDIIEGNTAAKLQALVQLSVAIALFISDLESAAQIALVVQLIERALVEVGHQAPSIALVDLKQIACSLEGLHVQCSMVYCTYAGTLVESALPPSMLAFNCYCTCQFASPSMPVGLATHLVRYVKERLVGATIGSLVNIAALVQTTGFRGDHWLQQIATQVTLTYRGNENVDDGLVPFYWVLVLPSATIASLTQGLPTDFSALPLGQANPCQTLSTALAKALHWVRQGHIIDSAAELSALIWRPTIEATSSVLKTESGRGGQAHWRNVSYIGASYCGIITADCTHCPTPNRKLLCHQFSIVCPAVCHWLLAGLLYWICSQRRAPPPHFPPGIGRGGKGSPIVYHWGPQRRRGNWTKHCPRGTSHCLRDCASEVDIATRSRGDCHPRVKKGLEPASPAALGVERPLAKSLFWFRPLAVYRPGHARKGH